MLLLRDIRVKLVVVILILLSSAYWPTNLPSLAFILCVFSYIIIALKFPQAKLLQGILLGLVITSSHITYYKSLNHLLYSQGHDITIKGEIQSLIAFNNRTSSILVQVRDINNHSMKFYDLPLLRLSIRDYQKQFNQESETILFKQGQLWEMDVKLRPPIGRHNEVGYKLEDYALAKGIHSYGKISNATLLEDKPSYRTQWFQKVYENTVNEAHQSLLLALTFGYKGEISASEWRVLRNSGLAHLMAISGLHIGFVFAIGWWLGKGVRLVFSQKSQRWLPIILGCLFAVFYAWLAGFSLPTIRALIACFIVSILLIYRLRWPKHQLLLWCLFLCLLLNPFSSLSMSFWLSFSAVCVVFLSLHFYQIFVYTKDQPLFRKWQQVIFIQFALFILLAPIQGIFFSGVSYLSPFINLLSVPWVSFFTVPLSLASVIMEQFSNDIAKIGWEWASLSISSVWWLAKHAEQSWVVLPNHINMLLYAVIFILSLKLLLPLRFFIQPIILLFIGSLFIKPEREWQVDFLDVGHGLSLLLSNQGHTVVYDTGGRWRTGSIAESVIEPILHHRGIRSIDGLILSHSDNDHAGGKNYLIDTFSPNWVRASEKGSNHQPCIKGEEWKVAGMHFTAIWPPRMVSRAYNPHSCVIKLSIDKWSFLLTGDIDAISEMLILNQNTFDDIDVFLVPHHGSNTSSTKRWVKVMEGKVGVVSAGRFTPWNLPNPEIKDRHLDNQVLWLDTAQLGQISLSSKGGKLSIEGYSLHNQNTWYRKLFGDNLNSE
ncbi:MULTISPECIES: DNA internalization-related competence protein ComEC/Rec2 [Aliivibrio]|uniref:DNA internalization-related competence protein ComEC/Rec2 n=1 Tax=Aliivibrio finisterrensis TaxID=511998 RepID=A0A4Q5KRE1_9GAMM|nr:DNA internalization-related competence protein ComEC/Rec2 [Aliivibrio finisterrensis]RYU50004.1 DNA internalization-related competence protein ComEC/Rec2 [Aliivibrio finisterrensis]RYU55705.1 DNA internalization-related competence protein ComEC/Rec2 [Aliivibrio finisterrensis]RYU62159.1 DNA internalization-related competence protein ComEC/Rec2 [Aliivibrio finisterrensis]RYU79833.1 DNA internalization-related competence protein ComEC/Rec2 [Aliivibrio finisterrensis]